MIPWTLFLNKYVAVAIITAGLVAGAYYKGYKSADNKWLVKQAEAVKEAVIETTENFKEAKDADLVTIDKLRGNRDYYKKLYRDAMATKPSAGCKLNDGMWTQLNSRFGKDISK